MPDAAQPKPYACRHIFTDGHQCGSPALRGEFLCYYHNAARHPIKKQIIDGCYSVVLPEPTDLHAVQRGFCELLRLIGEGSIPRQDAALLLRTLALAGQNLARIDRQTAAANRANPDRQVTQDYVAHPTLGTLAPAPEATPEPTPHPDGPLPIPYTPLVLPPRRVYVQSEEQFLKVQKNHIAALEQAAAAIYLRARKRAANHAALYPLHDDTAADRRECEINPDLEPYLQRFEDFGLPEHLQEQPQPEHSLPTAA